MLILKHTTRQSWPRLNTLRAGITVGGNIRRSITKLRFSANLLFLPAQWRPKKSSSILLQFQFEFELFEKAFFGEALEPIRAREAIQDVYLALGQYISQIDSDGRASTAMAYENALQLFKKYQPQLAFREITPAWLSGYEKAMLAGGRTSSTVGIYLRVLRIVANQALDKEIR